MKRKQIQEAKFPNMILASERKEKQYQCVLKGKQKKNTMPVAKQSQDKVFAHNAGDPGLIPGQGRSPGEGKGNPLQYSSLEIPWTEEADRLQSTRLQKSQLRFGN